jgi:hypothetical protein
MKTKEQALQELNRVNNNLTLLMKKKRALQTFIKDEEERLKGLDPKSKAWALHNDEDFIKEHGRKRKPKEIARIMNYSERQVQRFLKED